MYPTHGAHSFCTAIGRERAADPLNAADEDTFVATLRPATAVPPYILLLQERNHRGPDIVGSPFPPLPALDVENVRHHIADGAVLVDARQLEAWAAHVPGAISILLRQQFGSQLGWLVPDDPLLRATIPLPERVLAHVAGSLS